MIYIFLPVGICWLIYRRYDRAPTIRESWHLVAYSFVLVAPLQLLASFTEFFWPEDQPGVRQSDAALLLEAGVSITVLFLLLTFAYRIAAPTFIEVACARYK